MSAGVYIQIDVEDWVISGVQVLKNYRSADGRWKSFPYYYTLLALSEFEFPTVIDELNYTKPVLEKVTRGQACTAIAQRRKLLAERVLNRL